MSARELLSLSLRGSCFPLFKGLVCPLASFSLSDFALAAPLLLVLVVCCWLRACVRACVRACCVCIPCIRIYVCTYIGIHIRASSSIVYKHVHILITACMYTNEILCKHQVQPFSSLDFYHFGKTLGEGAYGKVKVHILPRLS